MDQCRYRGRCAHISWQMRVFMSGSMSFPSVLAWFFVYLVLVYVYAF